MDTTAPRRIVRSRPPPPTSPRAAAQYLLALRPLIGTISGGRRALVRSIQDLVEDARRGASMIQTRAITIGNERLVFFQEARRQFESLAPPLPCEELHRAMTSWFDEMMAACNVLITAGVTDDLSQLHRAQEHLEYAGELARFFNEEHDRLIALMREITEDARPLRRVVRRHAG